MLRRSLNVTRLPDKALKSFLENVSVPTRKIVLALRETILETAPEVEETLLWGGLSYHLPQVGGRVKGAVCQIGVKGGNVRLDFIHGIWLNDPMGILQGDLVSKRFIPILTIRDASRKDIVALIHEAATFDRIKLEC